MSEVIQHKYIPRASFMPYHMRHQRFSLIVAHRRAGKTRAVVADQVVRGMRTQKPDWRGGYIAPTFGQAKAIAWAYIKNEVRGIPNVKISESECSVVLPNGSKIRCYGVDNPDALRGQYFDDVICDEFGEWEGRAYTEVIRPALADRQGNATFIGTPKGPANKFAELRNKAIASGGKWFYLELKASETGILPQSELDELRADMDPEEYEQELEVSFSAANKGAYFGKHVAMLERNNQIKNEELYDPTEKVSLAMDIGHSDACAIWFWQVIDGRVRWIDYWEEAGWDAEEVCEMLELRPYTYETVWLPHDAKAKTFRSKQSVIDVFTAHDLPGRKVPNPDEGNRIIHGLSAVRKKLRTVPMDFDATRTARGIDCLRNYSRKWYADDGVFAEKAKHDKWSHGADAFRYACLSFNADDLELSLQKAQTRRQRLAANVNAPADLNMTLGEAYTFENALSAHRQQLASRRANGWGRM